MSIPETPMHTHLYDRNVDPDSDDALAKIAARIPPRSRVLDVGTGAGALGRYLSQEKCCCVHGITYNPAEAEQAQAYYEQIVVGDLERELPSAWFARQRYDYIVCADVLEHLRTCDTVLADLAQLLRPQGRILVSVPNVTYVGVVASLLAGRFARTHEGLLDATHIRFFDRQAVEKLAEKAGMQLCRLDRVIRQPGDTEFRFLEFELLPPMQKVWLTGAPESLVYEYVLEMQPKALDQQQPIPLADDWPAYSPVRLLPAYEGQVYFDHGQGFSEEDSARALAVNTGLATLRLAGKKTTPLHAIRFDFVDRPGLFELHEVTLAAGEQESCWRWQGDWSGNFEWSGLDILAERGPLGGRLLLASSEDPHMIVRFDPPLEMAGQSPVVTLRQTGPQAYSLQAFAWAREKFENDLAAYRDALRLSAENQACLSASLLTIEHSLAQADVDKHHLHQYIESLQKEAARLELAHQQRLSELAAEREGLEKQLATIREEHHQLLVSPFQRCHARVRWLLDKLKRSVH